MHDSENPKFLEEKPLKTEEQFSNSKFGHEEIAATLAQIVKKCPTPFTLGLFAKWGSGKSTVANSLKKRLPSTKIPVVIFDVWKHEGDALRRTFLKETVKQLKGYGEDFFDQDFQLNEKLEQSISRDSESKFKFSGDKFNQLGLPIIISIAALVILAVASDYFNFFDQYLYFISALFGSATAGGILLWIIKQSLQLFSTETVTYGVDKFEDPHQFEEEFGNILGALKNARVLIIFDNLDRVVHDKVAEVLSTIKTFLEPGDIADKKKEVVFLVPCDARAIKQHLSNVYGTSDKFIFDPDEFLRKFFNSIIWIPDFIPAELESFARVQLKETGVKALDNDHVAWIITKAFRNNPRQVIQFINILLANYLLVLEREGAGKDFPDGFLLENIPQLTKYLILNQLFPEESEVLREKKILDIKDVKKEDFEDTDKKDEFLEFVDQTRTIPIKNLRIFFTLRRSEQEKKFPGFDSFIALLEDRKSEDSKKYFLQIGDFSNPGLINDFSQAIKTELETKANPVSSINLIHSLLDILLENNLSLTNTFYEEVNNILNGRCKEQVHIVSPDILDKTMLIRNSAYRSGIINQWINVMYDLKRGQNKYQIDLLFVEKIFTIFAKNYQYLSKEQIQQVQDLLKSYLSNNIELAKITTSVPEFQKLVITDEYIKNFMESIPDGGTPDDVSARLNLLNLMDKDSLNKVGADPIVVKMTKIQNSENQNSRPDLSDKEKIIKEMDKFIKENSELFSSAPDASRDSFANSLIDGSTSLPDWDQRASFIPILFETSKHSTAQSVANINSHLNSFFSNAGLNSVDKVFLELSAEDNKTFFDGPLYTSAETRAITDEKFRVNLFSKLSENRKKDFLSSFFAKDLSLSMQFIESVGENKIIFETFDPIWNQFDNLSPAQKQTILRFINSRKAGNVANIREVMTDRITACLVSTDQSLQQVGLEAFNEAKTHIANPLKRKIIKESLDWLRRPETTPKYQPFTIKAVLSGIDQLNDEEKNEFVHYVFDEIVKKSSDTSQIEDAFTVLKSINPKYEERKINFDDIKIRIDGESSEDVKKVLMSGLVSLKPSRTNTENKEFWSEVY